MRLKLSPSEIRICKWIGVRRDQISREKGRRTKEMTDNSSAIEQGIAVLGEYGFCKMHNLCFDLDYDPEPLPDFDCMWGKDKTDAKTIDKAHYNLAVIATKVDKPCAKYALMYWNEPWIEYLGYATAADVFQQANLQADYDDPFYKVNKKYLRGKDE